MQCPGHHGKKLVEPKPHTNVSWFFDLGELGMRRKRGTSGNQVLVVFCQYVVLVR